MGQRKGTGQEGASEFFAKYGAMLIALGRLAYDVLKDWAGQHNH